jgi:AcrR family transcriptional regulator
MAGAARAAGPIGGIGTVVYRRSAAACERQLQNRGDVLRAARAVVAVHGIDGLNMAAVAAEAGVAVGSLYRHFAGRSELVCAVLASTCAHELDVLRAVAGGGGPPLDRLRTAVEVFCRRARSSGRLASAMICEPTSKDPELVRRSVRAEMATILAGMVAEAVAAGAVPPQDPAISGSALVGAISEVLVGSDRTAPPGPADAAGDLAAPPPGHDPLIEAIADTALRLVGAEGTQR